MKTRYDPRHRQRIEVVKELFAHSFTPQKQRSERVQTIIKHLPAIDTHIAKAAPQWPVDKIAKIDLAMLRLSVYELLIEKKEPDKVILDEAVEIAKEFGHDTSPGFINGVLGSLLRP